jgi:hypothetical protein
MGGGQWINAAPFGSDGRQPKYPRRNRWTCVRHQDAEVEAPAAAHQQKSECCRHRFREISDAGQHRALLSRHRPALQAYAVHLASQVVGVGVGTGVGSLHVAMHSPGDCDPCGSCAHWPAVALQLYMTGVGGMGVGGGDVQVAMHSPNRGQRAHFIAACPRTRSVQPQRSSRHRMPAL